MPTIYRIRFNNVEEQAIECTLTDETGELDIIDIDGAEDAIRIVSQDNDESKYSPIKAKKCVIKFLNSLSVNVRTFSTGEDNRWVVRIKINSLIVFIGHLEQGDIEEPFQYEQNQIVVLTATDGLGVLKTHRLEDIYNVWTSGGACGIINENRIIDYIAACLGASGLELTINVINNLREQDNDDTTDPTTFGNIYAALYLKLTDFEDSKVGQYMYCYEVLEKILGHDCYLTQAKGQWWIIRVTELRQDFDMIKTVFDFNGDVLSFETLNYEKAIGLKDVNDTPFPGTPDATAYFSQDKTMLSLQRPVKYVTLRYNYENPFEILSNAALLRGAFITDLPDELDPDGHTLTVKAFETDCWIYEKYTATLPPVLTTQDSTEYTKVRYSGGVEFDRFLHFDPTADHPATYQLRSLVKIPTGVYDKFNFSMSFKWSSDLGGAKPYFVRMGQFRLYGNDGTFWACNASNDASSGTDSGSFWMETDSDFIALVPIGVNNTPSLLYSVQENTDLSSWISATYGIPSAPRSGKVEIVLWLRSEDTTAFSRDMASLNLEYTPYINGSYNIFNSQSDTSTRDGNYYSSIEDEVFITNAPSPIMKGALLKASGGEFVVVGLFYEGQQFSTPTDLATYGELRVRAYHNQFRNGDDIYRATCQGLGEGVTDTDGEDDHQDLIHRYFNRDIEPVTNGRVFQLVSQDVDLRNCEWTGTLIKNFDLFIGFVNDTYTFSYGSAATGTGGGGGGGGGGVGTTIPPPDVCGACNCRDYTYQPFGSTHPHFPTAGEFTTDTGETDLEALTQIVLDRMLVYPTTDDYTEFVDGIGVGSTIVVALKSDPTIYGRYIVTALGSTSTLSDVFSISFLDGFPSTYTLVAGDIFNICWSNVGKFQFGVTDVENVSRTLTLDSNVFDLFATEVGVDDTNSGMTFQADQIVMYVQDGSGNESKIEIHKDLLSLFISGVSRLRFLGLPVYADEAAAVAGGEVTATVYQTPTGELRIKL